MRSQSRSPRMPALVLAPWCIAIVSACGQGENPASPADAGVPKQDAAQDAAPESEPLDAATEEPAPDGGYQPTRESLRSHPVPDWFLDAKFGIIVHWGPYSVPAWAPLTGELDDIVSQPGGWELWFRENPYAEWYQNTMLIDGSPTAVHHAATWGPSFPYADFGPLFEETVAPWNPEVWAETFGSAGARYLVLTTRHHDGYSLWPTEQANPAIPNWHTSRDLVGDLAGAARSRGMRFGVYYSGGVDWTFQHDVILDLQGLLNSTPQTQAYIDYANAQWRELIERYQPSLLWNDIGYPDGAGLKELIAWYYNTVPEGLINDRFNFSDLEHFDYQTREYTTSPEISEIPWEATRGMGYSFGYNQQETDLHMVSGDELIDLLADVTSKNGNLLLNVGPMADGTIPAGQRERLHAIGNWLQANGEAIYGTRPWLRAQNPVDEPRVRFTSKGDVLYVILLDPVGGNGTFLLTDLLGEPDTDIRLVDGGAPVEWGSTSAGLVLTLPSIPDESAVAVRISPVPTIESP